VFSGLFLFQKHPPMSDHNNSKTKKPPCGGCEHGHDDSPLPQSTLVITSVVLTVFGLVLGWMDIGSGWLHTAAFAVATLTGGLLVFPAAWKALLKWKLDMNVLMTVAVAGAWIILARQFLISAGCWRF
jgi:Zn2+/Cd2+-exporting ATPase